MKTLAWIIVLHHLLGDHHIAELREHRFPTRQECEVVRHQADVIKHKMMVRVGIWSECVPESWVQT